MLFDDRKWFEGQVSNLIGKNIMLPSSACAFFKISEIMPGEGDIKNVKLDISLGDGTTTSHSLKLNNMTAQIVGQISGTCDTFLGDIRKTKYKEEFMGTYQTFLMVRFPSSVDFSGSYDRFISLTEVLQNGGKILP